MTRRRVNPVTTDISSQEVAAHRTQYSAGGIWLLDDQLLEDCQKRPTDYLLGLLKKAKTSGLPLVSMTTGKRLDTLVDTILESGTA